MSFNWEQSFPYKTAREIQAQSLTLLAAEWDNYDVFVLSAPTAFGKTAVARTIMNACRSVSVITPTNLLVNQFLAEFPDTPTLSRMDSYRCEEWKRPCPVTRAKLMQFCKGCKCSKDLATAKFHKGPGIYNFHTYLAHKLYRDVLVIDEAHNLVPVIRDRLALKLWQHDLKYPHNMWRPDQMLDWIASLTPQKQKNKKIQLLKDSLSYRVPTHIANRTTDWFNGKGTLRNEPEQRDLIKLLPVDISESPPMFWPWKEVKKLVLMSATIGRKDIEQLGLGKRRVLYIDCKSPIPSGVRPIIASGTISVNRNNMEQSVPLLAEQIQQLADKHIGQKGVIHATYQLASLLSQHLNSSRYLYHNRDNKKEQYELFRRSDPSEGRVLVASGMYEGIDLPEDLGRWQVIAKIPWPSLGNPAIKHLANLDPEWYIWEVIKTTIQACGRICRTPEDFGITYILDRSFWRMYYDGKDLLPKWFLDAVKKD